MKLLINSAYIIPMTEELYERSPISMFDIVYNDSPMHLVQRFPEWINGFIASQHSYILNSLDELDSVKKIHSILSSNDEVRKLSFQLFPYQFDLTYTNWENIKEIISMYIFQKKGIDNFPFRSFSETVEFFNTRANDLIEL